MDSPDCRIGDFDLRQQRAGISITAVAAFCAQYSALLKSPELNQLSQENIVRVGPRLLLPLNTGCQLGVVRVGKECQKQHQCDNFFILIIRLGRE